MGLVAEFDIRCEVLPLATVADAVPAATIVLDLQFTHGDRPLFLATITGGPETTLETALDEAHDVDEWTRIGQAGTTRRYQMVPALSFEAQLGDHVDDLQGLESLATAEAYVERIEVTPDGWRQTGWFATRDAFTEFSTFWRENAGFRLHRLRPVGEPESPGEGLTDPQQEALRTAYERGYFEIPRRASLDDVAAELGISASSLSERLRRAQTQLVQETVATTWPPLPD